MLGKRGICYGPVTVCLCLCRSVSVTCRCSTKTAKCRITQTTPYDRIARGLYFYAKDLREILPGQPVWGRQMQVGWVKIGEFQQITGYISKTVKDRHIVSINVEWEVVCALYRMVALPITLSAP